MARTQEKLPVGTKIRFKMQLTEPASGDHPELLFAEKDELGEITGYNEVEGYMVKTDSWPASFGAVLWKEFEPMKVFRTVASVPEDLHEPKKGRRCT